MSESEKMDSNQPARLFISYSHKDEGMAKELLTHLKVLVDSGTVCVWYDRMIEPGQPWNSEIEEHLSSADIVVYCISADFIASDACRNELKKGLVQADKGKTSIVLAIFRDCGWKDVKMINTLQALPKDGKPIATYPSRDTGYQEICQAIKTKAERVRQIRAIRFTEEFESELSGVEALSSLSFSNKGDLKLTDIFVYPELRNQSSFSHLNDYVEGDKLIAEMSTIKRYAIAGEAQSGKTALCRQWVRDLFLAGYYPVLLPYESYQQEKNLRKKIKERVKHQFVNSEYVVENRIVPIFDDFHRVNNKQFVLDEIAGFEYSIIIVDDIYNVDVEREALIGEYSFFKIEPFSALKRNDLITKWVQVQEKLTGEKDENYQRHDALTRDVDFTLGKVLGRGVIPAYPFFVLSILVMVESAKKPLDGEITSQGYCYQTLLTISLINVGVTVRRLDAYLNLLTHLGYFHFKNQDEISKESLDGFISNYRRNYNLIVEDKDLLKHLAKAGIYVRNSSGKYMFGQRYLKYYFIAKFISENPEECKDDYRLIVENIGRSANAYIAVFITHHSKTLLHIEEIRNMLDNLFSGVTPGYLQEDETAKLDAQAKRVLQAALPNATQTPSAARRRRLEVKSVAEKEIQEEPKLEDPTIHDLVMALRGADALGQIIKCRAGSIKLDELKKLIASIIKVHAKMITAFISTFESPGDEEIIVDYIAKRLGKKVNLPPKKARAKAEQIFWNLNFFAILGITFRCISDVGADSLLNVVKDVCATMDSPFTRVIPYGVEMWFNKQLNVDALIRECQDTEGVVKWVFQHMVARYCATHKVKYDERQRIESGLGIKTLLRNCPIEG